MDEKDYQELSVAIKKLQEDTVGLNKLIMRSDAYNIDNWQALNLLHEVVEELYETLEGIGDIAMMSKRISVPDRRDSLKRIKKILDRERD